MLANKGMEVMDNQPTKSFKGYTVWLIISITILLIVVGANVLFYTNLPKNCPACELATVGLVPYWLVAAAVSFVNIFVIPFYLLKYSRILKVEVRVLSWVLLVASLSVAGLVIYTIFNA